MVLIVIIAIIITNGIHESINNKEEQKKIKYFFKLLYNFGIN